MPKIQENASNICFYLSDWVFKISLDHSQLWPKNINLDSKNIMLRYDLPSYPLTWCPLSPSAETWVSVSWSEYHPSSWRGVCSRREAWSRGRTRCRPDMKWKTWYNGIFTRINNYLQQLQCFNNNNAEFTGSPSLLRRQSVVCVVPQLVQQRPSRRELGANMEDIEHWKSIWSGRE